MAESDTGKPNEPDMAMRIVHPEPLRRRRPDPA